MSMLSEPRTVAQSRPSSHLRLSSTATLYRRLRAAEIVIERRLRQLKTVEEALMAAGASVPARSSLERPQPSEMPAQFGPKAIAKRGRSAALVTAAIRHLKATTHKSRSPGKGQIAEATRLPNVIADAAEMSGLKLDATGVTTNVFRSNQDCLDLYLTACLPKDAEKRKAVAVPSWAVRMEHDVLIDRVRMAEADRDQLTRYVMVANELYIAPEVSRIRREVVRVKAERMTRAVG